jgi:hypothetical protein
MPKQVSIWAPILKGDSDRNSAVGTFAVGRRKGTQDRSPGVQGAPRAFEPLLLQIGRTPLQMGK